MTQAEKTIKKFESIIKDINHHIDNLDATYNQCKCCDLKKYTNRKESLIRVDLRNLKGKLEDNIQKLQKYGSDEELSDD